MDGEAVPRTLDGAHLAERAEEVRAWFVQVRGGALFLSSTDASMLARWLEDDVSVVRILQAVELAAAHRRAKRVRRPFTLKSCSRFLDELLTGGSKARAPGRRRARAAEANAGPVAAPVAAGVEAIAAAALEEIGRIQQGDAETTGRARCARARRAHEDIWAALAPEREALLATAAAELEELKALLDEEDFARACEEAARAGVRATFPALSASAIWQECERGVE